MALFCFRFLSRKGGNKHLMQAPACGKEHIMLKTIITDAIVSPGYEGSPALKFSEKGDAARFRIGKKLYASNAAGGYSD